VSVDESDPTNEKILILCRSIPEESTKYFQTICVAGVTDQRELRRLYPVQFKPFQPNAGIPFRKKDWIQVVTSPPEDGRDRRRESRKINMDTVKVLRRVSDEELHHTIRPLISASVGSVEETGASLGLVKPKILDYQSDIISTSLVDDQLQITPEGFLAPKGMIKLGQESSYTFVCEKQSNCTCKNQPHRMRILDWEVNELYRNVIKRTTNPIEIALKMKEKMFHWMRDERLTYFMVGTHHRWKTWMVVSVLYFRRDLSESLEDFFGVD